MIFFIRASVAGFQLLLISLFYSSLVGADASIEVRVVDDTGKAVPEARVVVGWNALREHGNGPGVGCGVGVSGITNNEGLVKLSVQDIPGVEVTKAGYYKNGIDGIEEMPKYFVNPIFSLNEVKVSVVISRMIKPVPMYVRFVRSKIPSFDGKDCGFDLEVGDWVAPFGKGKCSDFIFNITKRESEPKDWDLDGVIRFGLPDDGIIKVSIAKEKSRNQLRLPAVAPLNGYENIFKWSCYSHRGENRIRSLKADPAFFPGTVRLNGASWDNNDSYIFRIRSKKNAVNGSIMALYGKIHGPISVSKDGLEVQFRYYLNPDGTTGLEWDLKTNLAKTSELPLEP